MAASGGGVVFVRNAADCGALAGPVEFMAAHFLAKGVEVRGVVLRRGPVKAAVEVANRSFPNEAISAYATTPLVGLGHTQTPVALVVDAHGKVVKVETVHGRPIARVVKSLEESLGIQ